MRLVRSLIVWLSVALCISCAGFVRTPPLRSLVPAKGQPENYALGSKGAWALASQVFGGKPKMLKNNVFAWPGMRDTLSVHEQAVLSVIDGDTLGGYWSTYEIRVEMRKGGDGKSYPYEERNYIEITLPSRVQLSRIVVHTLEEPTAMQATKAALEAYTLHYYNDYVEPPTWVELTTVSGNSQLRRVHDFAPVNTWKVRLEFSRSSFYGAGWVKAEGTEEPEYKIPKVSEIEVIGVPILTDEPPPPRPQPEMPPPPRKRGEKIYYVSSAGDTTAIEPEMLKPVSKDSLARLREARKAKAKEKEKTELFVLDPRDDVVDERTGRALSAPQIDLINARCFPEGDHYSFSLTVAGSIVGKGGELVGSECQYGLRLDVDGDGRTDLECRRHSYAYSARPDVVVERVDAGGVRNLIEETIATPSLFKNTVVFLVPAQYVGKIESFESAGLQGFSQMDGMVDRCGTEQLR